MCLCVFARSKTLLTLSALFSSWGWPPVRHWGSRLASEWHFHCPTIQFLHWSYHPNSGSSYEETKEGLASTELQDERKCQGAGTTNRWLAWATPQSPGEPGARRPGSFAQWLLDVLQPNHLSPATYFTDGKWYVKHLTFLGTKSCCKHCLSFNATGLLKGPHGVTLVTRAQASRSFSSRKFQCHRVHLTPLLCGSSKLNKDFYMYDSQITPSQIIRVQ